MGVLLVLGMTFQAMGEMMLKNEKSREDWMGRSIAGNHMSLPIYRITPAEGVVLHNYGIDRVAKLFRVNDLNGLIDPRTNGFKVDRGLFAEESVTRFPLIVIKCNSLRGTIAGKGLPVGPAPQGPFLRTCLNRKFSSVHIKLIQGGAGGRDPRSPSYFTRRGDGIPVTALYKFFFFLGLFLVLQRAFFICYYIWV
jgi:hypothetical protein